MNQIDLTMVKSKSVECREYLNQIKDSVESLVIMLCGELADAPECEEDINASGVIADHFRLVSESSECARYCLNLLALLRKVVTGSDEPRIGIR